MRRFALVPLICLLIAAGCGGADQEGRSVDVAPLASGPTVGRPFQVHVPGSYRQGTPMPLVLLLHGYTGTGVQQEAYMRLQPLADQRGFLYVHPDGTVDGSGNHFWNATDACCNLGGSTVDDVGYLSSIIDEVEAKFSVDPKRIYLVGHSNGGFMAYRMACDRSDRIAAIVSLAGATFADTSRCTPSSPVSVVQIHGSADTTIDVNGGALYGHAYPSAATTVSTWAGYDGCTSGPTPTGATLDLDTVLAGAETTVQAFGGCRGGAAVQLWTMAGGGHGPAISPAMMPAVVDFLFSHPKP
jgi:polyhydroxybutyrate depolymerase